MITYTFNWSNGMQVIETFTPFGSAFSLVDPVDGKTVRRFLDESTIEGSFANILATLVMYE